MTKGIIFTSIFLLITSAVAAAQDQKQNGTSSQPPIQEASPKGTPQNAPPPGGAGQKPAIGPSVDSALALAQAAIAACKAKGVNIVVSVVDSEGQAKVTLGSDTSSAKTVNAVRKAATAAAFKASGSEMEERAKNDKAFSELIASKSTEYNIHTGSLPIKVNGEVIGGIGSSGAAHEICEECCREAVSKVSVKLP